MCLEKVSQSIFFYKIVKPIQKWIVDMWRDDKIEKITEALAAEKAAMAVYTQVRQEWGSPRPEYPRSRCDLSGACTWDVLRGDP